MSPKGRRTSGLAVLLAFLIAVSAACGESAGEAGERSGNAGNGAPPAATIVGLNCNPTFDRRTPEEQKVHDIIQEKTGADVQIVFYSDTIRCKMKRNAMLSAGEQLDFAEMSIPEAVQAYNAGIILPLNDLLDRYGPNLKKNVLPAAFEKATYNGNILGIPIENAVVGMSSLQLRADWLTKLNLPLPKTIGEFEQAMQAFKERDPDGNGLTDTVALSTGSGGTFNMLEVVFGPSFLPQAFGWWKNADGRLLPPELHPGYKEMLGKFVEWNRKGYIWSDMLLSTAPKQQELIARNKVGAVAATFSGTILNAGERLRETVPDYDYTPVVLEGNGINKLPSYPIASSVWVVFRKNADPATVLKFFDFQGTYEGNMLAWFGVEGETYTMTPDGIVEFIAEDKTDLAEANYYARYKTVMINWPGKPAWPGTAWTFQEYNRKKDQANSLPRFETLDAGVFYDTSQWESFSKLPDMNRFLDEQKVKIYNGEMSIDSWDLIMRQWLDMGGRQMIDDRNAQYERYVAAAVR